MKSRAEILEHVRMLVRQDGVTVIWATHLVDEVGQLQISTDYWNYVA